MADSQARRRFLLAWPTWVVWLLIIVAIGYFAWVLAVGLNVVRTPSVDLATWARIGAGLFVVIILLELLLLIPRPGRGKREAAGEDEGDVVPATDEGEAAPVDDSAFAPKRRDVLDVEYRTTDEQYRGLAVLELSHPPKSVNEGGVYAKTYVRIDDQEVLRIEDLVADAQDAELEPATA